MTIHEYGKENEKTIVLIHPAAVMWDYFDYVIPLLKEDYHLIVPALPGYDKRHPEESFTSVERIADALARWFDKKHIESIDLLYGCSMGGAVVLRMVAAGKISVKNAVVDGGITPYQLPWIATRFIALRDFLMISMGKIGGLKLLEKAFSTDEYSAEDLEYIAGVLHFMSYKTIWRTFDSCNNYRMPEQIPKVEGRMQYWYGDKEEKDRKWDIRYVKKNFPETEFIVFPDAGHASMASLHPGEMAERLKALISGDYQTALG